jgi:hypothetical protein
MSSDSYLRLFLQCPPFADPPVGPPRKKERLLLLKDFVSTGPAVTLLCPVLVSLLLLSNAEVFSLMHTLEGQTSSSAPTKSTGGYASDQELMGGISDGDNSNNHISLENDVKPVWFRSVSIEQKVGFHMGMC